MQDRFVGDIGDFGKYGLLRALTGIHPEAKRLSLGVVWYVPDETTTAKTPSGHGQKVGYLFDTNPKRKDCFRSCDPCLFDSLRDIVCGERNLKAVNQQNILEGSVFFEMPVSRDNRESWTLGALNATEGLDIVFLDPDNGITLDPNGSTRHAYIQEIQSFVQRGRTVVIYHHIGRMFDGRGAQAPEQMRGWATHLRTTLSLKPEILWYRRGNARAYFVLPRGEHADTIRTRLAAFRASAWFARKHFTPLPGE